MARPSLSETEKLSAWFPHVRCTPLDKEAVKQRAKEAGLSMSEYIRRQAVNGKVTIKQTNQLSPDLMMELRKIGVNLNQLVKAFHQENVISIELNAVYKKLQQIFDNNL